MPFSKEEKQKLLEVKFVGETVIKRFEQIGIDSLEALSKSSIEEIRDIVSDILEVVVGKILHKLKNRYKMPLIMLNLFNKFKN